MYKLQFATYVSVGRVAQSVYRMARGWTVFGSNPGEARFSAPVQSSPGALQPPVPWVPGLSRG